MLSHKNEIVTKALSAPTKYLKHFFKFHKIKWPSKQLLKKETQLFWWDFSQIMPFAEVKHNFLYWQQPSTDNIFSCHPGWSGPDCDVCIKLPGCSDHGHCSKPMECECDYGYEGHFCHKAKCREGCNATNGFCDKPGECWCRVGWTGPKCETCVPYPGCQNGYCEKPWECICNQNFVGMLCDREPGETTSEHSYTHYPSTTAGPAQPAGSIFLKPPNNFNRPNSLNSGIFFKHSSACPTFFWLVSSSNNFSSSYSSI